MLGRAQIIRRHTKFMFGADCMAVSRTAQKYILGGSGPLPFEECPRSRSRLCCNERLASALILAQNGRGGRTPLDERNELPVVRFCKCIAPNVQTFRESTPNLYITHSDAALLWSGWGDR